MTVVDHLGREVDVPDLPQRIVSLCPSQTETLFDLGVGDRVVGVTNWCIHPEAAKSKARVGGTKKVNYRKIHELKPDLIIAEKEEQTPEMIAELEQHYPVYITDVTTLDAALTMIADLGMLVGEADRAVDLCLAIDSRWRALPTVAAPLRVAYLIWQDPIMAVGSVTYIHDVLTHLGFANVFAARTDSRYPSLTPEALAEASPDFILLSSEPYSFAEQHLDYYRSLCPQAQVQLVDGEMFSWYGSRMLPAADYLEQLIRGN